MITALKAYKFCKSDWRTLRIAALTPFLAAGGALVDSYAVRGEFKPVIVSYHALCARDRRDWRCARVSRLLEELAANEKTPGSPAPSETLKNSTND